MGAGRNIHALDPYRMPSQAALERGAAAGQGILKAHRDANNGTYPETVAVPLLSSIPMADACFILSASVAERLMAVNFPSV